MGGEGRYYGGAIGVSSQDLYTDCGNDIKKGQRRGMVVGLGGRDIGSYRVLSDKGVLEKAVGKNCGVCIREKIYKNFVQAQIGWRVPVGS